MKRVFLFIICFHSLLITALHSQESTTKAGLSLATYELPTHRTSFTSTKTSNYYKLTFDEQKSTPTLVLNKRQIEQDNWLYLLATTLNAFNIGKTNNFGSIGLPSPVFDPLVNDLSGPNDYLLLQQHDFQRKNVLPTFIATPRFLQVRF